MWSRTSSRPGMPNTPSSIGVSMNPGQIAFGADAGAAVVDREVLREDHDRALRRVVGAPARGSFEPLDARDRHDAAALAVDERLLEHARDRVLAHEEGAGEIDVEHALPLVAVEQVRGTAARDTGRGHDRVEPTVLGDRGVDRGRDRGFVPHVGGDERRPRARREEARPRAAARTRRDRRRARPPARSARRTRDRYPMPRP